MKTFLLLSMFVLNGISAFVSDETPDFITILTSNVWAPCDRDGKIDDDGITKRFRATYDTLVMLLEENGKTQEMTAEYYLSSTPDTTFYRSKIGNKQGSYVIINTSGGNVILTINSFSENRIEYTFRSNVNNSGKEFIYDSVVVAVKQQSRDL